MEDNHFELKFNESDEYMYRENHEKFYANSLDVQTSITDFMINFKQSTL